MNFYEELLTLGQHLHERELLALYKFLLKTKDSAYKSDALELLNLGELRNSIANGEIFYSLKDNVVCYSARKSGSTAYQEDLRQIKLSHISKLRINKLIKFFFSF